MVGLPDIYSKCTPKEIKKYLTFMSKNTAKLMPFAATDVKLLGILLDNELLVPDLANDYQELATKKKNVEATAMLLDYIQKGHATESEELSLDTKLEHGIEGKIFVIAGKLHLLFLEPLKKFITRQGGILAARLTDKTDYLICSDVSKYSEEVNQARSMGVKVISENEFIKMLVGTYE